MNPEGLLIVGAIVFFAVSVAGLIYTLPVIRREKQCADRKWDDAHRMHELALVQMRMVARREEVFLDVMNAVTQRLDAGTPHVYDPPVVVERYPYYNAFKDLKPPLSNVAGKLIDLNNEPSSMHKLLFNKDGSPKEESSETPKFKPEPD